MTAPSVTQPVRKDVRQVGTVTIRFAGDSGDGMQLTGDRFTSVTAKVGNDLATLPDFPAEIRAPAGSLPGVSGFQLHFADHDILTPGDAPEVLVAMNPRGAADQRGRPVPRRAAGGERGRLHPRQPQEGGLRGQPAGRRQPVELPGGPGPRHDADAGGAGGHRAVQQGEAPGEEHVRPGPDVLDVLAAHRAHRRLAAGQVPHPPQIAEANVAALAAGFAFGETTELFAHAYEVKPAKLQPGRYRQITGNLALAYGLIAAAHRSGLPLFLGSYPITPASDILHELSKHKNFGVRTFQAEDEIAGIGAALGAAFAGNLAVTTTSGPGSR